MFFIYYLSLCFVFLGLLFSIFTIYSMEKYW